MRAQFWKPFWHGGFAALLLFAAAAGMYLLIYRPAVAEHAALRAEAEIAAERQTVKRRQLAAMQRQAREIELGDPQTVKEILRVEINRGGADEFLLNAAQ